MSICFGKCSSSITATISLHCHLLIEGDIILINSEFYVNELKETRIPSKFLIEQSVFHLCFDEIFILQCAKSLGIDYLPIDECANGVEGIQLEHEVAIE